MENKSCNILENEWFFFKDIRLWTCWKANCACFVSEKGHFQINKWSNYNLNVTVNNYRFILTVKNAIWTLLKISLPLIGDCAVKFRRFSDPERIYREWPMRLRTMSPIWHFLKKILAKQFLAKIIFVRGLGWTSKSNFKGRYSKEAPGCINLANCGSPRIRLVAAAWLDSPTHFQRQHLMTVKMPKSDAS